MCTLMTLKPTSLENRGAYGQGWFSARQKDTATLPRAEIGQKYFLPGRNDNNTKYMPPTDTFVLFIEYVVSLFYYLSTEPIVLKC